MCPHCLGKQTCSFNALQFFFIWSLSNLTTFLVTFFFIPYLLSLIPFLFVCYTISCLLDPQQCLTVICIKMYDIFSDIVSTDKKGITQSRPSYYTEMKILLPFDSDSTTFTHPYSDSQAWTDLLDHQRETQE